ncbi:catechol 2,3-dioxygenase-like lactoylglutathione lyase family enzyme [Thermosporothrix hazakensis]|jgi:catechol 2,3-dioxygenase-like lactoylglutathione lyase family enzyme|uniref:Catechol 2,3-dioxygenase-like lactoylglutathione lyase family enzyme n=1 Tax=Thermosporothrix hazakensis TaxID=644383 RepID=A0A326UB18_THEHA|nr:VOC family protein [Thermosporothrix hazakensis]PZW34446.1 catechol 2,3-dioxygenase-like lactoylglutathione lyase family enzyme [Thermosporothrix hazakensis]GCE46004.1 hypothetical protein KTH_08730 [Thermosporothrix hazakensis]
MTNWQGFHHVALYTPDLDATIAFYGDVLGMQVGEISVHPANQSRHCFITPGGPGLHFFEFPGISLPSFEHIPTLQDATRVEGFLNHIAFRLPDEAAGLALRERLLKLDREVSEISHIANLHNFIFLDNNGLLLEAIWTAA